jgi:hypothetical protein
MLGMGCRFIDDYGKTEDKAYKIEKYGTVEDAVHAINQCHVCPWIAYTPVSLPVWRATHGAGQTRLNKHSVGSFALFLGGCRPAPFAAV